MLAELEITTEYGLPEGYTLRGATLDDLPEAVAMFNACSRQLIGTDEVTLEGYRHEWEVPILNLSEDVKVVIAPDGSIAGCQELWDLFDPHTRLNTWGRVHPDHQGRGIALALLRWAEERARRAILRAPQGTRVVLLNWLNSLDTAGQGVMIARGFQVVRHSYRMRIDMTEMPPAAVWPEGLTLRAFEPGQDDEIVAWVDREAFRDHWGFVERPLEDDVKMLRHWMGEPQFDPTLWLLVMDGGRVVGISLNHVQADDDPDMGWVGSLGVLREYRRKGLGLALLHHSFGEFYRRGKKSVGLGVDAQTLTGALRLYERAGMRVCRKHNTYEKELRPGLELSTQAIA